MGGLLAFSIKQPWAWLIAHGYKPVENRDWRAGNPALRFRGRFLIHTGMKEDVDAMRGFIEHNVHPVTGEDFEWDPAKPTPIDSGMQLGGIVGEAEIYDVVTSSDSPWFVGPYGLLIRNAKPLPFIPCKGALGFFRPDLTPGTPAAPPPPPRQGALF